MKNNSYLCTIFRYWFFAMINRALLRIKSVQMLYSFFVSKVGDAERIEEELRLSISKSSDLYYCVLQLIVEARRTTIKAWEHLATVENPEDDPLYSLASCRRFRENKFAAQLDMNDELRDYMISRDMEWVWEIHRNVVFKLLERIAHSEYFEKYAAEEASSYESDKRLWRDVLQNELMGNEDFENAIEDMNIYWNDDLYNAISFGVKTIKHFGLKAGSEQSLMPIMRSADELEYPKHLVRYAMVNYGNIDKKIEPLLVGWTLDRLPVMDLTIMRAAIAEMEAFEDIHVGVTINEYIEIAKAYCADSSIDYISAVIYGVGAQIDPLSVKPKK